MTSRVFPSAPAGPLVVAAGGQSVFVPFEELAGGGADDLTMFLRLVKLGSGCAAPGGPDPLIRLKAGGGPAVEVTMFPDATSVHDGQGVHVADAMCDVRGDGVYRVRVFIARPRSAWQLQIANQDTEPRGFTWVVADNDQEAQQPWIDLPASVGFEALAGQQVIKGVRVANLGTGPLTIGDAVGLRPGPGFELVAVPGPVSPNGCGELQVRFTASSTPGTSTAVYTARSDDPTAGHNRRVTLTATTHQPDVAIMAVDPQAKREYMNSLAASDFVAAMNAVFRIPHPLGTITFPPNSAEPTTPAAVTDVRARLLAAFPSPAFAIVAYFSRSGDPNAGTAAVRDARRKLVRVAATTSTRLAVGSVADSSFEVGPDVFDVAGTHGVTQPAVMVVDLNFQPVGVFVLVVVDPQLVRRYADQLSQGDFFAAMRTVCEDLHVLGKVLFQGESAETSPSSAITALTPRMRELFPSAGPIITFPDHFSRVGDAAAGTAAARDARLNAIRVATTTAAGGGASAPGAGVFEVPPAVFDIAKAAGLNGIGFDVIVVVTPTFV